MPKQQDRVELAGKPRDVAHVVVQQRQARQVTVLVGNGNEAHPNLESRKSRQQIRIFADSDAGV